MSRTILVLLAAGFLACGGGAKPPATSAPATASAACAAFHAAYAQLRARCSGGSVADWRATFDNEEDCAALDRYVVDGTLEYKPAGWAACLAEFEQPCAEETFIGCRYEILHGLVPDGQPCAHFSVCGTTSSCLDLGNETCGAICMRGGNLNEACALYCGDATPCSDLPFCSPGLVCGNGTCVEGGAVGDACSGAASPCQSSLICRVEPSSAYGAGTCAARVAGGPCAFDGDCLGVEFCSAGSCAPRRAKGAGCADAPTGCVAWTACDSNSDSCLPAGAQGQKCAPYPGSPAYLTCRTGSCADGVTCSPFAGVGQGCAAVSCGPGLSCDSAAVTCVACP